MYKLSVSVRREEEKKTKKITVKEPGELSLMVEKVNQLA